MILEQRMQRPSYITNFVHNIAPPLSMCRGVTIERAKECQLQSSKYNVHGPCKHHIIKITAHHVQST